MKTLPYSGNTYYEERSQVSGSGIRRARLARSERDGKESERDVERENVRARYSEYTLERRATTTTITAATTIVRCRCRRRRRHYRRSARVTHARDAGEVRHRLTQFSVAKRVGRAERYCYGSVVRAVSQPCPIGTMTCFKHIRTLGGEDDEEDDQ